MCIFNAVFNTKCWLILFIVLYFYHSIFVYSETIIKRNKMIFTVLIYIHLHISIWIVHISSYLEYKFLKCSFTTTWKSIFFISKDKKSADLYNVFFTVAGDILS